MLGNIYGSKGKTEKAIHHFKVALRIVSSFNSLTLWLLSHYALVLLFARAGKFDDAHTHIEHTKLHATNSNDEYFLAQATKVQALFWHIQHRFEEAKSEALHALNVFDKLGASNNAEEVRGLLRQINRDASELDDSGKLLETVPLVMFIDSSCSDGITGSE